MNEIRSLVWDGVINLQVSVKQELLIRGVTVKECSVNLRIPRNSYLPLYLPFIKDQVGKYLKTDIEKDEVFVWFEFENVPLYWNYPVGVLYDSMTSLNPSERKSNDTSSSLYIWTVELAHGSEVPLGVIPLIGGREQIRSYWMHQWKQACFILNGSAKQMMSLAMQESKKFWESVIESDRNTFDFIATKIIPSKPRCVPLFIHQSLPEMKVGQPTAFPFRDEGHKQRFVDVLTAQFPLLFDNSRPLVRIVCCGIEIPLDAYLYETYLRFFSHDGFLHVSLCLLTESDPIFDTMAN